MKWFKMYTNLHRNVKVQSLTGDVCKTWLNLLSIYGEEEKLPSTQQVLYETRMDAGTYQEHLNTLLECGLFESNEQGQIMPHDWDQHNPKILSTERVQKHRATKQVKRMKQMKHVSPVSVPENSASDSATENVSRVSLENKHFLGDFQKNTELQNGTVKHVSPVTAQTIENAEDIGTVHENENDVKRMKHLKHPRLEEIRLEEIREEKNSHPYPLSEIAVRLPDEKNGASALLNSSQNGKAHEPTEPQLDAFSIWAHAVYQRHPKQKNLHDTLWTLKQKFANRPDDQKLLDENHPLWIAYWQLDPSYPRFVPGLADRDGRGWLNDQVWRKPPPPPPVADTKHARAKAWADKFKGETQ
jgi:hypothetical protein